MLWDIFCRVVDNLGDAGVCWRLSSDLAARGETVRLWIDDPAPLTWMAPDGCEGVTVMHWTDAVPEAGPGDVVVEAFGCDPPEAFVARMARRALPPAWINLEYLSAEPYVERCHRLPSPQTSGPGAGLVKRFFYPGFTPATGGLLREPGLLQTQAAFDRDTWLADHGIERRGAETVVSLFCYAQAPLDRLLDALAGTPTLLLAAHGTAAQATRTLLGKSGTRGALRVVELPLLTQTGYDRLLWSCDLNFVRGEDSFVRAQWAGAPFVWQIYPQHDGAHAAKLEAFVALFLADADTTTAGACRELFAAWNGLGPWPAALPDTARWTPHCRHWRDRLRGQTDLGSQLIAFAQEARGGTR